MAAGPGGDAARLRALLSAQLGGPVGRLRRLAGGAFSRAHAFAFDGQDLVVRVSAFPHAAEAFAKDDYAWRHFASPALPIPRVLAVGRWGDEHFAISQRVPGRRLAALPSSSRRALLPAVLDALDAVGRVDLGTSRGYGDWGPDGHGRAASWHEHLADAIANEDEGFYQDWHAMFETTFLERPVYESVYRRMLELAAHCPDERALIHRDLHFDNLLADGQRVTGVIDWGNAAYGDRLYDAAWVGWVFAKEYRIDAATPLRERYGAAPRYAERIGCYVCHIGLDDMRYFARTGQRAQYEWTRDRLLAILAERA